MRPAGVALAALVAAGAACVSQAAAPGWEDVEVRVQYGAPGTPPAVGRTTRWDGCLYVRFDHPARDGLSLIRLDQVTRLHVRSGSGWVARDLQPLLRLEPKRCLEESNG